MIDGSVAMVTDSGWVTCWSSPSVATRVKGKMPLAVGVPLISPVEGDRVSPVGRLPSDTDQVYDPVPPEAVGMTS